MTHNTGIDEELDINFGVKVVEVPTDELVEIFAEIARSYDGETIWKAHTKVNAFITKHTERAVLEARIDALQSIKKENKFGFERLDLVVEYQDGSNSGVIPYRKRWNDAYDRFVVTVDDAIATLTQQLSELEKKQ